MEMAWLYGYDINDLVSLPADEVPLVQAQLHAVPARGYAVVAAHGGPEHVAAHRLEGPVPGAGAAQAHLLGEQREHGELGLGQPAWNNNNKNKSWVSGGQRSSPAQNRAPRREKRDVAREISNELHKFEEVFSTAHYSNL